MILCKPVDKVTLAITNNMNYVHVRFYWVNALKEIGFEFYKAKKIKTIMIKEIIYNYILIYVIVKISII